MTMPYKEPEIKQLYWSIGAVAKENKVAPSMIRYLEQYFKLTGKRNSRGERKYTFEEKAYMKRLLILTRIFKLAYTKKIRKARMEEEAIAFLNRVAERNLPFGIPTTERANEFKFSEPVEVGVNG